MNVSISFRPKLADVAHPGIAPANAAGAPVSDPARSREIIFRAGSETGVPM